MLSQLTARADVEEISVYALNNLFSEGFGQDFSSLHPLYITDLRFLIYIVYVFTEVRYARVCFFMSFGLTNPYIAV